jgi:malic enzyme
MPDAVFVCPQLLIEHAQEVLPFVYTPVVGEACQKYSHLPITPRGLYININDKGRVLDKLIRFRPQASSRYPTPQASARFKVVGSLCPAVALWVVRCRHFLADVHRP